MKSSNQLLSNTFFAFGTSLTGKIANVVTFILIARIIGAKDSGIFSLATTYLLIFTALTWGLDELMIRQVARKRSTASQYFGSFLLLRLLIALLLYCLLVIIIVFILEYEPSTVTPILIFGLSIIPESLGYVGSGVLNAHEVFKPQFIVTFIVSILKLVGVFVAFFVLTNLLNIIGWTWFLASCIGAIIILFIAFRNTGRINLSNFINRQFWKQNFKLTLPFLSISFLITLEYQTDIVILSATRGETEVGIYSAATTILFALTLLPQAFRVAVYPLMTRYHRAEPNKLGRLYRTSFFFLGVAVLPIVVGITILSEPIIHLIYGEAFEGTVITLQVIIWALVFLYLNVPNSRLMLVNEQQFLLVILLIGTLVLNIILNLLLDPYLGAVGAAFARLISTLVFFVTNYIFITRYLLPNNVLLDLIRPAVSVLLMAAAVWLLKDQPLLIPILVGAGTYITAIILLHGIPKYEEDILLEAIRQLPIKQK